MNFKFFLMTTSTSTANSDFEGDFKGLEREAQILGAILLMQYFEIWVRPEGEWKFHPLTTWDQRYADGWNDEDRFKERQNA